MDEMKLNLGSKFMRKIASKLLMRYIKKQFGCKTEIELDELKISYSNGDVIARANIEIKMNRLDSKKILEKLDEDLDD